MTDLLDSRPAVPSSVIRRRSQPIWLRVQAFRRRSWADVVTVGVFGFLVSVAASWVPSVWYDESATVASATRSWSQLWAEIHTVDAVHAVYYFSMHVWFSLVGYSPFTLRLPSAVVTGIAAALVVLLARQLTDKRTGLIAGLVFVLLPRVTWMGGEGRSYATSTALVTALTLVFVLASRRSRDDAGRHARWWALYGLLAVASTALFLYSALVVIAHGITLLLWALRSQRAGRTTPWRSAVGGWVVSAGIAGALLIPLAKLSTDQSKQVGWIHKPDLGVFQQFFVTQWFIGNTPFAIIGWVLVAFGIATVLRKGARYNTPNVLQVSLTWMLVPVIGLIAVSLVANPLYSPRYVTFGAPSVALLLAVGLSALRLRSLIAAALVVCIALTVPTSVEQRQVEAKDNSSWKEVAALISHERATEAGGGADAIVYGYVRRHPTASARVMAYTYPKAFAGLTDVTLKTPVAETGALWETRYPLDETIDRVDGHRYVWLVTSDRQDIRPEVAAELATKGYHVQQQWHFTYVNVVRYER